MSRTHLIKGPSISSRAPHHQRPPKFSVPNCCKCGARSTLMLPSASSMDQNVFQKLPLELIRTIFSFCSSSEIVLVLPRVSRLLYRACVDTNLLRNVIRRDLSIYLARVETPQGSLGASRPNSERVEESVRKVLRCIDSASRSVELQETCWMRWAIGLSLVQENAFVAEKELEHIDFDMLLKLMRYLPHSMLVGVPTLNDPAERHWIVEIIAVFFLDVTGGSAFRTKHFVGGLDMHEMNLRMALSMTVLILQLRDESKLFKQEKRLAGQSIAGWISSAIVYSRDWMAMSNQPPRPEDKLPVNAEIQTFITIMFIGIALLRNKEEVLIMLPDIWKLPLFSAVDPLSWQDIDARIRDGPIAIALTPLDLPKQHLELGSYDSEATTETMGLQSVLNIHHKAVLEDIDEYLEGTWCIYYIIGRHCNLRDMQVMPPAREVCLHASRVADDKWIIESDPFNEDSTLFRLSGRLVHNRGISRVILEKNAEEVRPLYESHLHGQLSPFGISGGYFYTNPWAPATEGGLFWMFKEEWVNDVIEPVE